MKFKWVIGALLVGSVWAAQSGAKVKSLVGQVEIEEAGRWRPLKALEDLGQGRKVRLPAGGQLLLLYRRDGHREQIYGPAMVLVGADQGKLLTKQGRLLRGDYQHQALQVPRSGTLDAVGGHVENANLSRQRSTTLDDDRTRALPPAPPQLAMPAQAMPGSHPIVVLPEPEPVLLAVETSNQQWSAVPGAGIRGELVLREGDTEVKRLPIEGQAVPLSELSLGHSYRLHLERDGAVVGTAAFRTLEAEEEEELKSLLAATAISTDERLHRLDRFSELGLFHLAAREGGLWLEESGRADADVLQVVVDLYRSGLGDLEKARYWKEWGQRRGLQVLE